MKHLVQALTNTGNKDLAERVLAQEAMSDAYGVRNVLRLLAKYLLDNKFNLARKYSFLIDESSITYRGCTFTVSDEDGNTHGRLMASLVLEASKEEVVYDWKHFKVAEDFDTPRLQALQVAAINFLKKNDMIFDFIYYEGPYERVGDIVSITEKEVRAYANNLVNAVKAYLR